MLIALMKSLRRQRSRQPQPAPRPPADIRLHIGGQQRHPGWNVLDIRAAPHVDYVGSCTDLSMLAAGSVAEIYASHVLEHLGYIDELGTALQEWHRVLAPGGMLRISVPDLAVLCALFVDASLDHQERFHVMRMMFGGQMHPSDFHRAGLDQEILAGYLVRAGFVDIERVDRFGVFDDASDLVFKNRAISLNMRCRRA